MSDLRITAEMTGDQAEDTSRRAKTITLAVDNARIDPLIKLKMALGRAYSDIHAGDHRPAVVQRLRDTLADPEVAAIAAGHHRHLAEVVRARTVGERCGDYVSKVHHAILTDALALPAPQPEPPDAA